MKTFTIMRATSLATAFLMSVTVYAQDKTTFGIEPAADIVSSYKTRHKTNHPHLKQS